MGSVTVETAGETVTLTYADATVKAGAVPIGTASYPIPSGAIMVNPGGLKAAVTAAAAGSTLVLRAGIYNEQMTISKSLTIQNYPGEIVWWDGKTNLQYLLIAKAKLTVRGIGFRGTVILNDADYARGVMFPSATDGSLIENCWFMDFPDVAVDISYNTGMTVRNCSWQRAGENHLWSNMTVNFTLRNCYFRDANTKLLPMAPTIASSKHHRSEGLVIRDNIVDGVPRAAGIWLDESNYDALIVNNDIKNVGGDCVLVEASEKVIVAGNRGAATGAAGFRALISGAVRFWNNSINGPTNFQIGANQDHRRAPSSTPHYADGLRWITHDTEVCNNLLGSTHNLFMMYSFDNESNVPADAMVSKVANNIFSADSTGQATRMFGWGLADNVTRIEYKTVAAFQAAEPTIGSGNMTTTLVMPTSRTSGGVPIPADIATALGVAPGSTPVGPPVPAPVPA